MVHCTCGHYFLWCSSRSFYSHGIPLPHTVHCGPQEGRQQTTVPTFILGICNQATNICINIHVWHDSYMCHMIRPDISYHISKICHSLLFWPSLSLSLSLSLSPFLSLIHITGTLSCTSMPSTWTWMSWTWTIFLFQMTHWICVTWLIHRFTSNYVVAHSLSVVEHAQGKWGKVTFARQIQLSFFLTCRVSNPKSITSSSTIPEHCYLIGPAFG